MTTNCPKFSYEYSGIVNILFSVFRYERSGNTVEGVFVFLAFFFSYSTKMRTMSMLKDVIYTIN